MTDEDFITHMLKNLPYEYAIPMTAMKHKMGESSSFSIDELIYEFFKKNERIRPTYDGKIRIIQPV